MGGPSEYEGRVEYCINGMWSEVCDNGWNVDSAMTVCVQLGVKKGIVTVFFSKDKNNLYNTTEQLLFKNCM